MESVTPKRRSKSSNSHPSSVFCGPVALGFNDSFPKPNQANKCCRTIILQKSRNECYGFTLQTYAFKNYRTSKVELLTYVDYIEVGGPAFRAGMKRGDVILAVNDTYIENLQHEQLVNFIRHSTSPLRVIVMLENWCQRIDLNIKKLKLKQCLKKKYLELATLEREERDLLQKAGIIEDSSNDCSLDRSSDCFSPSCFCGNKARFMTNSHNLLDTRSETPDSSTSNSLQEMNDEKDNYRRNMNEIQPMRSGKSSNENYECRSLPTAGRKKHFLQSQIFSFCEAKNESLSKSSINLIGCQIDGTSNTKFVKPNICRNTQNKQADSSHSFSPCTKEQHKSWYGVPKSHRAALLKRQKKSSSEATKWYFYDLFNDANSSLGVPNTFTSSADTGFTSATLSKSTESNIEDSQANVKSNSSNAFPCLNAEETLMRCELKLDDQTQDVDSKLLDPPQVLSCLICSMKTCRCSSLNSASKQTTKGIHLFPITKTFERIEMPDVISGHSSQISFESRSVTQQSERDGAPRRRNHKRSGQTSVKPNSNSASSDVSLEDIEVAVHAKYSATQM